MLVRLISAHRPFDLTATNSLLLERRGPWPPYSSTRILKLGMDDRIFHLGGESRLGHRFFMDGSKASRMPAHFLTTVLDFNDPLAGPPFVTEMCSRVIAARLCHPWSDFWNFCCRRADRRHLTHGPDQTALRALKGAPG